MREKCLEKSLIQEFWKIRRILSLFIRKISSEWVKITANLHDVTYELVNALAHKS